MSGGPPPRPAEPQPGRPALPSARSPEPSGPSPAPSDQPPTATAATAANPRRSRWGRYVLIAAVVVAGFAATAVLVVLPPTAAAALLAVGSAGFGVLMVRKAGGSTNGGPRWRTYALGGGSLLAGLAAAASGVVVATAPDAMAGDVPLSAEIPLVTLFFVAACYLFGLLRPAQPRGPLARLRAGLDMVGLAVGLIYTPWLLLFGEGERRGASITALLFGCAAAAATAVAGVHAVRHRAALLWCGPGAALSLVGLTAFVVAMDFPDEPNAAIAAAFAAGAVNVAAAMLWHGAVRIRPDDGQLPPAGSETTASFPLFALPLLGSALATAYHLIHGGNLDATSIILATTVIVAVAGRELIAAVALRRQADHLTDQGNRLRSLVFGSSDVAMILDADLVVRWQSPAAARQFGLSDQDVFGRPASALVDPVQAEGLLAFLAARMTPLGGGVHASGARSPRAEATSKFEVRLRDGFGRWRTTEWATSGDDPAEPGRSLVVHIRDVSDQRDLEEALQQVAYLDRQTTLVNRQGLRRAADPMPHAGALMVIELSGLTALADMHGPDVAEVALAEAARRLRTTIESTGVPARLADSRFAVLTDHGAVRAHLLASRLLAALSAPYAAAGTVARLSASAGLADVTADADIDEVIRRATLALRAIRADRSGAVEWYDEAMELRLLRRSMLEEDLAEAVARAEFDLSFQPILELPGRRPVGVEALLRWRHRSLGWVPASELLPLAEDVGLLEDVNRWLLNRVCRQLSTWRRRHDSLWMAVNVRSRELLDPVFQASLHTAMEAHEVPASALVIEVTEQDLVPTRDDSEQHPPFEDVTGQLARLRAEGIQIAVDNFGTGPTSLSRLRILPVDLLKIDRDVFGQPADQSQQLGPIMDVAVTLGRRLGLEVIAHGLETEADLETVQGAGCRLGQGDLLGRAMPPEHLEALLDRHRNTPHREF
jgi:predicted signal transduction protein with EAL and GGDEF domain